MSRRRKNKTLNEFMVIGIVAGALYLILDHLTGIAGYAAVAFGGVLVGLYLRPWTDRIARRCGVRIVWARGRRS